MRLSQLGIKTPFVRRGYQLSLISSDADEERKKSCGHPGRAPARKGWRLARRRFRSREPAPRSALVDREPRCELFKDPCPDVGGPSNTCGRVIFVSPRAVAGMTIRISVGRVAILTVSIDIRLDLRRPHGQGNNEFTPSVAAHALRWMVQRSLGTQCRFFSNNPHRGDASRMVYVVLTCPR